MAAGRNYKSNKSGFKCRIVDSLAKTPFVTLKIVTVTKIL